LLKVFSVDLVTPNFAEIGRVDSEMKRTERHCAINEFRQRYMVNIQNFILCMQPAGQVQIVKDCERKVCEFGCT
jgi:hypothetical protein